MATHDDSDAGRHAALERDLVRALDADRQTPRTGVGRLLASGYGAEASFPTGPRGERLLARARAIFLPERPGVLKLVLRHLRGALEVIEAVGDLLEPAPARGDGNDGVLVRHRFGDREVTAHVSASEAPRFVVTLDIWGARAPSATRVSLFRGDRELASELPRTGRVMLPELPPGQYRVVLSDAGEYVGELDLTFTSAAA
ncbi:MAG: hypothetical protein CVU56_05880 [Deltaproteobacteria bacterium HGW-Deltaproteobacteria-14]|jgi:hypothetical protein|nr:MAG: hypothetical protein CVU56_05880 [Deltaproteobacteria bacterium HGW-Deltaproteobacteria-14]